jgi:hypothetical protein
MEVKTSVQIAMTVLLWHEEWIPPAHQPAQLIILEQEIQSST